MTLLSRIAGIPPNTTQLIYILLDGHYNGSLIFFNVCNLCLQF